MKKIPTIFKRDLKLKCTPVTEEINHECQWVFDGEGIATRKVDGINVKIEPDPHSLGFMAYVRVKPNTVDYIEADYEPLASADKRVIEAVSQRDALSAGIYEVYGEGIRGNPEKSDGYHMVRVDPVDNALVLHDVPRSYRGLMGYFATRDLEGIVFHHPDRIRMAKIKTKDFYHLTRP
jgi:hypothetical protein